ncbi:hypothetical protein [Novosphingobium sp. TCA1]|uniref:hypothetical protein n=1 Tax=Novosphingobium sp. TCA1 TaxID=2682474 RepID=UPI00130B9590|nr:hypothetical protein [Novosphingobium sp. TCA1]GFE75190.1 hypothetical protein NTCA1_28390 [Novosphingobium sp. TCA1]
MVMKKDATGLTLNLDDCTVQKMGDGVVIVLQRDHATKGAPMQNVVLTRADLEAMLAFA